MFVLNSHLVDNFALLGVRPVLLPALTVASCHLHLMRKIVSNPRTEKDYQKNWERLLILTKITSSVWTEKNCQQVEIDCWYRERWCTIWECQIGSAPSHVVVGTERTLGRNCLLDAARTFTSQVDVLVCFPVDIPHSNSVLNQITTIQIISLLGEWEELRTGHEVVTSILAQVVRVLVVVLQSVQGEWYKCKIVYHFNNETCKLSRQVFDVGFLSLPYAKTCFGSSKMNFSG